MLRTCPSHRPDRTWTSRTAGVLALGVWTGFQFLAGDAAAAPNPASSCAPAAATSRVVSVRAPEYGAKADGRDDTAAIQKAFDDVARTGGTVRIPKGVYMIDATRRTEGGRHGLALRSGTTLRFEAGAVLKAIPNGAPGYAIILVANARNVNILGGVLEGERNAHQGSEGQWGMGISFLNARDVVVEGVTVKDCWGDGFYVGGANGCSNITFCGVTADRNRRQGLSIVNAEGVVVRDSTFKNTSGTDPQCGVDLEPNAHQTVKGVLIRACTFTNNTGGGMWGGPAYEDRFVTTLTDCIIENCTFTGNGAKLSNGAVVGFAACSGNIIRNNLITGNLGAGIQLRSEALNHLVTGNLVTGTKGDGILLEDCAGSIVSGNTVTGNSGYGIKGARGHGATIGDNTVSANGRKP
jgi:parallel beta-helix repeat protein